MKADELGQTNEEPVGLIEKLPEKIAALVRSGVGGSIGLVVKMPPLDAAEQKADSHL